MRQKSNVFTAILANVLFATNNFTETANEKGPPDFTPRRRKNREKEEK